MYMPRYIIYIPLRLRGNETEVKFYINVLAQRLILLSPINLINLL